MEERREVGLGLRGLDFALEEVREAAQSPAALEAVQEVDLLLLFESASELAELGVEDVPVFSDVSEGRELELSEHLRE